MSATPTNAARADWAHRAIDKFRQITGTQDESLETVIRDFLCDLRHLADEHGLAIATIDRQAHQHYLEERAEENEDDDADGTCPASDPEPGDPATLPDTCPHCGFCGEDDDPETTFETAIDVTLYNSADLQYNGGGDGGFNAASVPPAEQPIRLICQRCYESVPLTEAQAAGILDSTEILR